MNTQYTPFLSYLYLATSIIAFNKSSSRPLPFKYHFAFVPALTIIGHLCKTAKSIISPSVFVLSKP